MDGLTKTSEDIPPWVYAAAAGGAVGLATVGTIIGAWLVRKRVKSRDARTNENIKKSVLEGEIESLRASTPREQ